MSVHIRANFDDLVNLRGIEEVIWHFWEQRNTVGRGLFNVYESTQAREHSKTVGGVGLMEEKAEGEAVNFDAINDGFLEMFTHVNYAKALRVTEEMMDDELYGVMEEMAQELAYSAHATEETLLANHLNNGFDTNFAGPDGLPLFSTAHIRENGDTYANNPSTDAALSTTSLEQGLIDFRNFRDGGGKRLQVRPRSLIVPADLQFTAATLLESTQNPTIAAGVYNGTAGRGDSSINPVNGLGLDLVVWDYLTSSTAWFLAAEKAQHKLTLYDRRSFDTDYVYDFDTGDYKVKGSFRQASGWKDPRGVYGTDGVA